MFTPAGRIVHYGGQTTRKEPDRFVLQFHGAVLIYVKTHYGPVTFALCRLFTAAYLLERVPYWLFKAARRKEGRGKALRAAKNCWRGCRYTLGDWTRLLMNRDTVAGKL